jgi:hypothetical protein
MVMTMMATTATMAMTAITAMQDKAPMAVTKILPMEVTSLPNRFHH